MGGGASVQLAVEGGINHHLLPVLQNPMCAKHFGEFATAQNDNVRLFQRGHFVLLSPVERERPSASLSLFVLLPRVLQIHTTAYNSTYRAHDN